MWLGFVRLGESTCFSENIVARNGEIGWFVVEFAIGDTESALPIAFAYGFAKI